jgi:hypothetical protein
MILIDGKEWRPIAFVDELVQRILVDEKTETRRIARVLPNRPFPKSPYGKPGDRLWVRESFATFQLVEQSAAGVPWGLASSKIEDADLVVFRDGSIKWRPGKTVETRVHVQVARLASAMVSGYTFRPPMHLPFWAHRIDLEVKTVLVEQLQQITEEAAIAEGFQLRGDKYDRPIYAREQFRNKWNDINGGRKDAQGRPVKWDDNPTVWVVTFERIKSRDAKDSAEKK